MAFNFNGVGIPLAVIKDDDSKNNNSIVYLHTDTDKESYTHDIKKEFEHIHLKTGNFQVIPNKNSERTVNMVIGSSGSGKTFYICNWIKEYRKIYKKNEVYLFSALKEDVSIDKIKPKRIILDDEFLQEPSDLEMYRDSVVVFDDCESLTKHLRAKVYEIMSLILTTGRHYNISVFVVSHQPTKGHETKLILSEAQYITYFPADISRQLVYMLENYCGLDKKEIAKIKKLKSRWTTIYRRYPKAIITEKDIMPVDSLVSDGVE